MKQYRWDKVSGVVDSHTGEQVIQIVGGTMKFRKLCGILLVERLNVKEKGDYAQRLKSNRERGKENELYAGCTLDH